MYRKIKDALSNKNKPSCLVIKAKENITRIINVISGVSKRTDRRYSSITLHNTDPNFVPKTVLQLSESENGSNAIGN
jgi:hypothetical protein